MQNSFSIQNVKLVSYSKPVIFNSDNEKDILTELVAYCARVSNPSNQMNMQTSEKLIRYLINEAHWSPLEMVSVCMEITTTRDIARQILRHRSFSFQEFSQRYATTAAFEEPFVLREARLQDNKNRQNSIVIDDPALQEEWEAMQAKVISSSQTAYKWALNKGIAKEQARAVLPEGLTPSRMYMNGTLRSWVHYIDLREKNGTQKEHMEIALLCKTEIAKIFPMIVDDLVS